MRPTPWLLFAVTLAGCVVDVPLNDKRCDDVQPCLSGWVCASGSCVA